MLLEEHRKQGCLKLQKCPHKDTSLIPPPHPPGLPPCASLVPLSSGKLL